MLGINAEIAKLYMEVEPYTEAVFIDGRPYENLKPNTPDHIKEKLKEVRRLEQLPEYEPIR